MDSYQRGITLIELMIAVAIVGILATVAIFAYNKYIRQAKSSEVPAMFAEISKRQEEYAAEHGGAFLSTGANEGDRHPASPAGPDEAQDSYPLPATWVTLRINPDKRYLYCSYVSIAGTAGTAPSGTEAASFGFTAAPPTNWFYHLAECDFDGDSNANSFYFARSDLDGIASRDRGR